MQPKKILETALYVSDLAKAKWFYRDILGLALHSEQEGRHLFFRCGDSILLLFNPGQSEQPSENAVPAHGCHGAGHIAWEVTLDELASWKQHLLQSRVPIELEYTWPSGARSLYFRDPAGNSLEFATASLWQQP